MLTVQQMQLIQNLKLQGYTKSEIIAYYTSQGLKPPSRPALQKYYDMDVLPENPGEKLATLTSSFFTTQNKNCGM